MTRGLVALNAGSSSIKFGTYRIGQDGAPVHVAGGKIEKIGLSPSLLVRTDGGEVLLERAWPDGAKLSHEDLLGDLIAWAMDHLGEHKLVAVGHRVVHGGARFVRPVILEDAIVDELDGLGALAPLHQPHNLAAIRAISRILPDIPQVACFDTAFHATRPEVATRFALPRRFHEQGIRRYGFHGLSYEYVARRLAVLDPALAGGRVIVAHLGNGASLCAMHRGKSVDTTMGFTALDGLMMGTRSGSLDPGVVLHLIRQQGMSAADVEAMLYNQSGLLGVSGISSDMRTLEASAAIEAEEAMALFAWRAAREAGGLVSSLGGLDGLVFTAGIGENDSAMRARICERLGWAGIEIDTEANSLNSPVITTARSRVAVRVVPTDEERMIALHTLAALESKA